jgi:steroid delta-isomerase-like uncharacterized protein
METELERMIRAANDETYRAWCAHDADAVAAVFAPDAQLVDQFGGTAVGGRVFDGRAAIREFAAGQLAAFSDFALRRLHLVIDGDANADQWEMTGTNDGELFGLPPTGRRVTVRGATFSKFDDAGLVIRDTHYIDYPALLRQLGHD